MPIIENVERIIREHGFVPQRTGTDAVTFAIPTWDVRTGEHGEVHETVRTPREAFAALGY